MPSYAKSTPAQVKKRLAEVSAELEAASPDLYAEMRLLERIQRSIEPGGPSIFEGVTKIFGAVERCFDLNGDWMTRDEIYKMMVEGGYPLKPDTGKYLLLQTLNHHAKVNHLVKKVTRDGDLWGKPEWVKST